MKTRVVSPKGKEVLFGDGLPTGLIGERINPFGKSGIKEALLVGDTGPAKRKAYGAGRGRSRHDPGQRGCFRHRRDGHAAETGSRLKEIIDVPFAIESRNAQALDAPPWGSVSGPRSSIQSPAKRT